MRDIETVMSALAAHATRAGMFARSPGDIGAPQIGAAQAGRDVSGAIYDSVDSLCDKPPNPISTRSPRRIGVYPNKGT